jgi:hypothetical protein
MYIYMYHNIIISINVNLESYLEKIRTSSYNIVYICVKLWINRHLPRYSIKLTDNCRYCFSKQSKKFITSSINNIIILGLPFS